MGLGGTSRRSAPAHLLVMGALGNTSLMRFVEHAKYDRPPTSSPMAIPDLVGGAIVVCSNRQVNRKRLGICPYRRLCA